MERNVNYTVVGLFVAFVLLSFAIFTIWLAGTYDSREYMRYTVLFDNAVNGLEEGSVVKYRGVSVGRIIDIRLVNDRPDLIKVDIEVDKSTPILANTKGALKPQGITGLSFIELKTDGSDKTPLVKQKGENYPMIKAEASQLDKLFDDAPELSSRLISLADNLNSITGKIDLLLDEDNMAHLSETLVNIHQVSESLNNVLNENNTKAITSSLKNIESTSKKLNRVATAISKNEDSIERFTGEGIDEMTLLINDSRDMVQAIKELAQSLNDEPSRIIFQPNYDGVKIKK